MSQSILSLVDSQMSALRPAIEKIYSAVLSEAKHRPGSALLVGVATWIVYASLCRRHAPPGPPRLPLLGNILQVPSELQFIPFTEWSEKYGPIFSLDFPGRHVIVLNTFKAAADLLDRCSDIYNGRPRMVMSNEILSGGYFMPLVGDLRVWRRFRRAAHEGFSIRAVEKYQPIQAEAAAIAMLRTVAHPEDWEHNLEIYTASSIYSSVYGWPALGTETNYAKLMQDFVTRITSAAAPGAFLVDFFPIMKYIPAWMARWKREGLEWHEEQSKVFEEFNASAAAKIAAGDLQASFASGLTETEKRHGFSKKESAWLSSIMIAGGTDTSATVLTNFVLAMVHYPDVMRKAQAELDAVVGRERAPAFEDKDSLPYIRAIIKETLRWRPIAPLGVPHRATEDHWYEGYFIPKGCLVIGNIWDPSLYPDFDTFRPERFLDASGKETAPPDTHQMGHSSFGFGRRTCVGMHFADQALFIGIATLLWAFDIKPYVDERGNTVLPPTNEWIDSGLVVRAPPFKCSFSPRFSDVPTILEANVATAK
ncbi:cytochrome P450 [Irpex rosettiformis]|uniref:Cytochrome P450 n=1 Tax=Irpex rosettiformis TaxID=378272 RepID=A0ACB8U2T1_9APHY|nr:cytochrome P450 [Irpex rosettiformis]